MAYILVRANLLAPHLHYLHKLEIDPNPLLKECGLTIQQIEHPTKICFESQINLFMYLAARYLDDGHFALQSIYEYGLDDVKVFGHAVQQPLRLGNAIKAWCKAAPHLQSDGAHRYGYFLESGDCCFWAKPAQNKGSLESIRAVVASMVKLVNRYLNSSCCPITRIEVPGDSSDVWSTSPLIRGTEVQFEAIMAKVIFPIEYFQCTSNHEIAPIFDVDYSPVPCNFIEQLKGVLPYLLIHGNDTLPGIATALGVSTRTMQRDLKEAGKTFKQLVSETRVSLAKDRLMTDGSSVANISTELGYTNYRNFARAFKKYTGIAPDQWRRSNY